MTFRPYLCIIYDGYLGIRNYALGKEVTALQNKSWFKLDNAGKIFPGQNTSTWSNIFRFSVLMKEKVKPEVLEQALKDVLPRFPCFDVCMKRGFFWYYLKKNPHGSPEVKPDIVNPCYRVKFNENRGYLFRVYYYENKISVDFYHALTDGRGASLFTCTLVAQYLRLLGYDIPNGYNVLDINQKPTAEELEDPFPKCAGSKAKLPRGKKWVYHSRGTKLPNHMVNITSGIIPLADLKAVAKSKGVTITEFVETVLLYTMYLMQKAEGGTKPVSVQIPVDLRNVFGINTLRNFSLTYNARIDPNMGEYTFDEVLTQVSAYLKQTHNEKTLRAMTTANLKLEQSVMKYMPLFIKDLGIGISFLITGEKTTSILGSNMGLVKVPDEMAQHVERMHFMAGPGVVNGSRCGAVGFKDTFVITVANIYEESEIERLIFTQLVKMGLHVKIESNRK